MTLLRRNGGLFPNLRTSLPELFDTDNFFETPFIRRELQPAVNIKENEGNFEIEVAAPGLSKKDFHVAIDNGLLTITSEKKEEKQEENENYTSREFSYSSFNRSFSLPESIDDEKINAKYEEGILKVILQKTPKAVTKKAKEIAIS